MINSKLNNLYPSLKPSNDSCVFFLYNISKCIRVTVKFVSIFINPQDKWLSAILMNSTELELGSQNPGVQETDRRNELPCSAAEGKQTAGHAVILPLPLNQKDKK